MVKGIYTIIQHSMYIASTPPLPTYYNIISNQKVLFVISGFSIFISLLNLENVYNIKIKWCMIIVIKVVTLKLILVGVG